MKKIKTIIIDDEPAAIEVLTELSKQLTEDIDVVNIATNGEDAIHAILQLNPDLIFLDIDMPKMNGLEVVQKLTGRNLSIIFTTGSASYALQAIKADAVDYLLKPIDPVDFSLAIDKVRLRINSQKTLPGHSIKRIPWPTQDEIIFLREDEIIHVIGMGSYCQLVTTQKSEKILISKNLGQVEEKLSDSFFRCHNSHIINLHFVISLQKKDGYYAQLRNGSLVEVSRRSKEELLRRLNW